MALCVGVSIFEMSILDVDWELDGDGQGRWGAFRLSFLGISLEF